MNMAFEMLFWALMVGLIVLMAARLGRRMRLDRELLESGLEESFERERTADRDRAA